MPDAGVLSRDLLRVADLHAWYGESHVLHGMEFAVGEGEVVTLLGRAAKLAAHSPLLTRRLSTSVLRRLGRTFRHGLPARWVRTLRLLGFDEADLAALRAAAAGPIPRNAPRSVAALLADSHLSNGLRQLSTSLRLYARLPSVKALAGR